jgi:hypothetical protein
MSYPQYPGYDPNQPAGQYGGYGYGPPAAATTNGLAIASLVVSLTGLLCGLTAPVGAILGHVARKQIRERGEGGDGLALAGIIVGWVITGLMVVGVAIWVVAVGLAIGSASTSTY